MNMKRFLVIVCCACALQSGFTEGSAAGAQVLTLRLTPGVSLPLGTSTAYFTPGLYTDLTAEFRLPKVALLYFPMGFTYTLLPINSAVVDLNLMAVDATGGVGIDWNPFWKLHLGAYTRFGYVFGFIPDPEEQLVQNVVNPQNTDHTWTAVGGGFAHIQLVPTLSLGVDLSYHYYGGLYSGLSAALGVSYHVQPRRQSGYQPPKVELDLLQITEIDLEPVFPVFYKYYDDHAFGTIVMENTGRKAIENLTISFLVKEYMDNAKVCGVIEALQPGQRQSVDLYALFNNRVLDISESTKLSANLIIDSTYDDTEYQNQVVQSLRVYDRNAVTWEDDRRAAAFVTMKDPTVLKLSKFVSGQIKDKVSQALNQKFLTALGMLEALKLYEISYVIDPSTPYNELSAQPLAVDYLQFPIQTLEYKAGDCDDLSILYCALLESVGIQTAFITVPGHIYTAVELGLSPEEADKQFSQPEELILLEDSVWLPVEVTLLRSGFLNAWRAGAQQWREYASKDQTGFFPLHEAWTLYEPVGFSSEVQEIRLPESDSFTDAYIREVDKFVDREIYDRVETYKQRIEQTQGSAEEINRLGVLYARYGRYEAAKAEFNRILDREEYPSALLNMGNLFFLEQGYEQALGYYERAYDRNSRNAKTVLALARTHHALENYSFVKKFYAQLKQIDSALAERFAYLELRREEVARAADLAAEKETILWDD
jgi:hypothetical protein